MGANLTNTDKDMKKTRKIPMMKNLNNSITPKIENNLFKLNLMLITTAFEQ